jgi:hypothetical protein
VGDGLAVAAPLLGGHGAAARTHLAREHARSWRSLDARAGRRPDAGDERARTVEWAGASSHPRAHRRRGRRPPRRGRGHLARGERARHRQRTHRSTS